MCNLTAPQFTDETKAREYLEAIRWPYGPVCPHCGSISDGHYALKGEAHRPGLWKCKDCRQQFTVTVGTVFERSKVALTKWLMATYLMTSSKKGISAHQLHRTLGVTYKTAWFMAHRIRHAMDQPGSTPFGDGGGIVEADETYQGKTAESWTRKRTRAALKAKKRVEKPKKRMVFALVERSGKVRSRHIAGEMFEQVKGQLALISRDAHFMTDESSNVQPRRQGLRLTRSRQPLQEGVRARHRDHEHGRGLLLDLQARHDWRVPALQRAAPAPLPVGIRFPLQQPHRAQDRRPPAPHQCAGRHHREATHVPEA